MLTFENFNNEDNWYVEVEHEVYKNITRVKFTPFDILAIDKLKEKYKVKTYDNNLFENENNIYFCKIDDELIKKGDDEYFYVKIKSGYNSKYYKCDSVEGLEKFLENV